MKQQFLTAVSPIYYQDLEYDTFGYANILIISIITHLTTTYVTLTVSDIKRNQEKLTKSWNPGNTIENLWRDIKIVQPISTQVSEKISDGTTIILSILALEKLAYTLTPSKLGVKKTRPSIFGQTFNCI